MTSVPRIARGTPETALAQAGNPNEAKAALRRRLLAERKAMDETVRRQWDTSLCEKVLTWWKNTLTAGKAINSIGVYWPIQNEPDLRPAYAGLAAQGVQLALPLVVAKGHPLEFAAWSPGEALRKDAIGIPVPQTVRRIERIDALVIPCLGYDAAGFRLGYGGGFYDRTLAGAPRPLAVGVSYSMARTEFPVDRFDVPMDVVLTETT